MRVLDILKQLHQNAHKGWVDESIGDVWVKDDWLKVDQNIQLVVHCAARSHFVVDLMQVLLELWGLNLSSNLFCSPRLKRQGAWGELECAVPFYILVADNWFDCRIWVMNEELINSLERNFVLIAVVVWIQPHDWLFRGTGLIRSLFTCSLITWWALILTFGFFRCICKGLISKILLWQRTF